MRQWHAPTRGSWLQATEICTAPHRQWPVMEEVEAGSCRELAGPAGVEDMQTTPVQKRRARGRRATTLKELRPQRAAERVPQLA
jgi:hypothetical protein